MMYGVAYFENGEHPAKVPPPKLIGWLQKDGQDLVFKSTAEALEACDHDGWRGYVCEYPTGSRAWSTK